MVARNSGSAIHPALHWVTLLLAVIALLAAAPATAQEPARASALVDAAWLVQNLNAPGLRILDLRSRGDYLRGHVPGAISADYMATRWRAAATEGGGYQMLAPGEFASLVGGFGIDSSTHVVLYAAGDAWTDLAAATEVFWLFRSMGHRRLSLLASGFSGYARESGAEVQGAEQFAERKVYTPSPTTDTLVSRAQVRTVRSDVSLMDMRLYGQYLGINKAPAVRRYGTIAGALLMPGNWVTQDGGGVFRDAHSIRRALSFGAIDPDGRIIAFGNTSLSGSIGWFAVREIVGNPNVRLYGGGLAEWTRDDDNPMERRVSLDE